MRKNSAVPLRMRILLGLFVVAFPMLILLLAANAVTFRNRQQENLKATQQIVSHAVELNTNMLNSVLTTVSMYAVSSNTPNNMQYLFNESEQMFARRELNNWMEVSVMMQYPKLEMFATYSAYSGDYLTIFGTGPDISHRFAMRDSVKQTLQSSPNGSNHWSYTVRNGVAYLENIFNYGDMYYCSLIRADVLDEQLAFVTGQDGELCLYNNGHAVHGGDVLRKLGLTQVPQDIQYATMDGKPHLVMPLALENPAMTAALVLSAEESLAGLTVPQLLFLLVAVVMAAALLLMYSMLQANVTKPVDILVDAMSKIGESDLSYRVDTTTGAPEFVVIGTTFNQMMDRVQQLTEEIYIREIENQKVRLRNLQMQINPHFLSNCLNVIHTASIPQNWEVVRQMTAHLTSYFRFMNSLSADEVLLEEELRYTRDFLSIQELRFPDKFSWEIAVPDFLGHARIPPLIIKTFAENTIKHARQGEDYVELLIEAEMEASESCSRLHLHIVDTGPGFSEEFLERWARGETISTDGIHHIGLDNIRSRLQLTYGEAAALQLENTVEGGAAVHLYIPLDL